MSFREAAEPSGHRDAVDTPALILDLGTVCTNLARLWRADQDGLQGVFLSNSPAIGRKNNAVDRPNLHDMTNWCVYAVSVWRQSGQFQRAADCSEDPTKQAEPNHKREAPCQINLIY